MAAILKNLSPSIDAYLLEEQSSQLSSWSDLKRKALGFFEERCPNNKNMSSDIVSVPGPKIKLTSWTLSRTVRIKTATVNVLITVQGSNSAGAFWSHIPIILMVIFHVIPG